MEGQGAGRGRMESVELWSACGLELQCPWPQGPGEAGPAQAVRHLGLPGAAWGTAGPPVMVCVFPLCPATVSAWRPDAPRRPPRTSPGSAGVSRPRRQFSSKDRSPKSRSFICFPTGTTRRVE